MPKKRVKSGTRRCRRDGLDVDVMADALAGPIFMRRLMGDEPLDPAAVRHLVEQLLPRPG